MRARTQPSATSTWKQQAGLRTFGLAEVSAGFVTFPNLRSVVRRRSATRLPLRGQCRILTGFPFDSPVGKRHLLRGGILLARAGQVNSSNDC